MTAASYGIFQKETGTFCCIWPTLVMAMKQSWQNSAKNVGAFYGCDINWFYCNIMPPLKYYGKMAPGITSFRIHSVDDYAPRAIFDRAMPREEATKLCREFMRTIPKTGLTVEHFFSFFCKERGAKFDC